MEQALETTGGTQVIENDPLSPDDVAAFLDGRLEGDALERVQARLADDPSARQEIIKARRIASSVPAAGLQRRRWLPAAGLLAAAAAIAVVVLQPGDASRSPAGVASERRGVADEPDRVEVVTPAPGDDLSSDVAAFAWRPIEGATYRIVVSDEAGRTLLQENTTDTALSIPGSLRKAGRYYFKVDAQSPDGSSVTSGVREFVVTAR